MTRDGNDRNPGHALVECLDQSARLAHRNIDDDHVDVPVLDQGERSLAVIRRQDVVTVRPKEIPDRGRGCRIVFDGKDARHPHFISGIRQKAN